MAILKNEAIVLRKFDFRETSLIAHFYTREFGKVHGLLKGIRKDPKKFASTVEIFSLNEIIFYQSRHSTLHLVSHCDLKDNFTNIRSNLSKISMASSIVELLDALTQEEDKNESLFDLAFICLKELETYPNPEKILTIFKIKSLALSGFKPNFDSCVSCNNKIFDQSKFSLVMGGLLCERCFKKDLKARSIFRGTTASIVHIQKNDFRANLTLGMNPEIKKELESILNAFLTFHLDKQLKAQKITEKITEDPQLTALVEEV
ncbi:MAG: DNA repair protein RecO [Candidatus Omnitrophica bacterium]|jgi:DNA repair protein RecO (recombination protein O)|nr:DNA repair protein RecO [Candidatus Omnitrophota bacterium]